jgi:hypothetical protein
MKHYVSDVTQFLNQLKADHPHLERDQQYGRSLLWDGEPKTLEDHRRAQISRVPKAAYEYYQYK